MPLKIHNNFVTLKYLFLHVILILLLNEYKASDDLPNIELETCEFKCLDGSKCITFFERCDDFSDCDDGSDEANCTVECQLNQFKCHNSQKCIDKIYYCDGMEDCLDSSDELDCNDKAKCQFDDDFMCISSKQCINGDFRCDGTHHCPDFSDEADCQYSCLETEFNCTDGTPLCIPLAQKCNGHNDCHNGNDELECKIIAPLNNTCIVNNGGCSHTCVANLIGGHYCDCPHGFHLASDHQTCQDTDECFSHGCSHTCHNTEGSYECQCNRGYALADDAHTCLANSPEPYLLVTNNTKLIRLGLRSESEDVMDMHDSIGSLDADIHSEELYYIQLNNKHILKAVFKGMITSIVTENIEMPVSLTFDWINRNLYWIDVGHVVQRARIEVINVDTKTRTTLLTAPAIHSPLAIVVDPREENQFIYWSQSGINAGIYKADLDGSNHVSMVSKDINYPNSLILDFEAEKLYWMDSHTNKISSLELADEDLDRTDVHIMHERHINQSPLASFEDWLYWVDGATHKVKRVHRYDGETVNFLFDYSSESDAAVLDENSLSSNRYINSRVTYILHPLRQKPEDNICKVHMNYNCSHICMRTNTMEGYSCFCPNPPNKQSMYIMEDDHKTCNLIQHSLSTSTTKYVITHKSSSYQEGSIDVFLKSTSIVSAMDSQHKEDVSPTTDVFTIPIWIYIVVITIVIILISSVILCVYTYKRREEKKMLFENPMFQPLKKSARKNSSKQDETNKTTMSIV